MVYDWWDVGPGDAHGLERGKRTEPVVELGAETPSRRDDGDCVRNVRAVRPGEDGMGAWMQMVQVVKGGLVPETVHENVRPREQPPVFSFYI
jgi:hypothetical protein